MIMDETMTRMERELMAAQELLFLVLDHIGEPVVIDMETARKRLTQDRRIDLDLNHETNQWTLKVVTIDE